MDVLVAPTPRAWLDRALADLDDVLVDHAHCEKKAASTALSLLFRYPERAELLVPLSRLAREELEHFEQVLAQLRRRGLALRHQQPAPYAADLLAAVRRTEPERLLDTLLCMALIEARSCERMALLADGLAPGPLVDFYRGLLASEARHHRAYVGLADRIAPPEVVRPRLVELARHEAGLVAGTPPLARVHG